MRYKQVQPQIRHAWQRSDGDPYVDWELNPSTEELHEILAERALFNRDTDVIRRIAHQGTFYQGLGAEVGTSHNTPLVHYSKFSL